MYKRFYLFAVCVAISSFSFIPKHFCFFFSFWNVITHKGSKLHLFFLPFSVFLLYLRNDIYLHILASIIFTLFLKCSCWRYFAVDDLCTKMPQYIFDENKKTKITVTTPIWVKIFLYPTNFAILMAWIYLTAERHSGNLCVSLTDTAVIICILYIDDVISLNKVPWRHKDVKKVIGRNWKYSLLIC